MPSSPTVRETIAGPGCMHDEPTASPFDRKLTRTGHVVGRVYFSADHNMHYAVVAATTKWQLAPDDAVVLLWQTGARTVTSQRRGADPECRSFRMS